MTMTSRRDTSELLVEIRIPSPVAGSGGAYEKLERKVGDFAIAGVAAQVTLNAAGEIASAGIGLTNVGPMPIRATAAEDALIGRVPDAAALQAAGELAAAATDPADDGRGPASYKRAMTATLTKRAVQRAVERARA